MATTARKKKGTRKSAARSRKIGGSKASAGLLERRWFKLLAHPVCRRIYGCALVLISFYGLYLASMVELRKNERFQLSTGDLMILDPPKWIPPGQLELIQLPDHVSEPISIFDPDLTFTLTQAYTRNAWVERVIRVEKVYPNDLRVELRLRKPVAAVWYLKRTYVLIDRVGVRLPGSYSERPDVGFRLPFIMGSVGPPPPAGQIWNSAGVLDGARVADVWQQSGLLKTINVTCIDVTNVGGRVNRSSSEIVLRLESVGTRILWGRVAVPDQQGLMPDDQKKIEILRNALVPYLRKDPLLKRAGVIDIHTGHLEIRPR